MPKMKHCRVDFYKYPCLVDMRDEKVLFVGSLERNLKGLYGSFKFNIEAGFSISCYTKGITNKEFKKLDGIIYHNF
jgi:hypothetical protein